MNDVLVKNHPPTPTHHLFSFCFMKPQKSASFEMGLTLSNIMGLTEPNRTQPKLTESNPTAPLLSKPNLILLKLS